MMKSSFLRHRSVIGFFRPWIKLGALLIIGLIYCIGSVFADPTEADLFSADGYRKAQYRSPTLDDVPGGQTITAQELKGRLDRHAPLGLVDVLPVPPRPADLPQDTLWLPAKHDNIPGSVWLPDTGQPVLSPALETYFKQGMDKAIGGDKTVPVVLYCREDCWMSWNAAKRAAQWGYQVLWYPGGIEAWSRAGYPLSESHPEPSVELGR